MHRRQFVPAILLFASAVVLVGDSPASAQFERGAWDVLVTQMRLRDATEWNGMIAAASDAGGIVLYDPAAGSFQILTTLHGLSSNRIQAVATDDSGRLWAGTSESGLLWIEPDFSVRLITSVSEQLDVRAVTSDGDFVYYGSSAGGGAIVNGFPEQLFTADSGLPSDDVTAVAAFEGRAWFGTPAGVGFFDRQANQVGTLNAGLGVADLEVVAIEAGVDGVFVAIGTDIFMLDESDPASPVWTNLANDVDMTIVDFEVSAGRIAVLGSGNRVWVRDLSSATWTQASDDPATMSFLSLHIAADAEVWVVGGRRDVTRLANDPRPLFWSLGGDRSPEIRGLFGNDARSLWPDRQGGVWVGCFPIFDGLTHWQADGSIVVYNRLESGGDDGWLPGIKNQIIQDRRGDFWVSSFTGGATRFRPSADGNPDNASYLHFRVSDDVLKTRRITTIVEDRRGRIWFASDGGVVINGDRNLGIDILVDPTDPTSPSSWLKVVGSNSNLAGDIVRDLLFEGDDVVWIAVEGVGLQRWDYDGDAATGEIEVDTFNDDFAWDTITVVPSVIGDPVDATRALAIAPDGRLWAATEGLGLFGFFYDVGDASTTDVLRVRVNNFGVSLIGDRLLGAEVDRAGNVWAGGDGGFQRVRLGAGGVEVDAFTNIASFLTLSLSDRFLPEILSPLPGGNVQAMAMDTERNELYLATDSGISRLRIGAESVGESGGLDVTLRPNPIRDDELLYIEGFEGELDVFIYTLTGVLLHTARGAVDGDLVWDTRNIVDERVVSGTYLARFRHEDGRELVKVLAVER